MDLILWRHAEAEEGFPDSKRRLTERGRGQADAVGRWLRKRLGGEYRLLSSPTARTLETAEGLSPGAEVIAEIATARDPLALLDAVGWPHTDLVTVVVGHQPTLGETAAFLLTGQGAVWPVKKGQAWWFRTKEAGGRRVTTLRAVVLPELL